MALCILDEHVVQIESFLNRLKENHFSSYQVEKSLMQVGGTAPWQSKSHNQTTVLIRQRTFISAANSLVTPYSAWSAQIGSLISLSTSCICLVLFLTGSFFNRSNSEHNFMTPIESLLGHLWALICSSKRKRVTGNLRESQLHSAFIDWNLWFLNLRFSFSLVVRANIWSKDRIIIQMKWTK